MTAKIINGKEIAAFLKLEIAKQVEEIKKKISRYAEFGGDFGREWSCQWGLCQ